MYICMTTVAILRLFINHFLNKCFSFFDFLKHIWFFVKIKNEII